MNKLFKQVSALNLEETNFLNFLDTYIDYCLSQGYTKNQFSTYYVTPQQLRVFNRIARENAFKKLGLAILGNKYRCLNLILFPAKTNINKILQFDAHDELVLFEASL